MRARIRAVLDCMPPDSSCGRAFSNPLSPVIWISSFALTFQEFISVPFTRVLPNVSSQTRSDPEY